MQPTNTHSLFSVSYKKHQPNNFFLHALEYIHSVGASNKIANTPSKHNHFLILIASSSIFMNSSIVPRLIMRANSMTNIDDFPKLFTEILIPFSATFQFTHALGFNYQPSQPRVEILQQLAQKWKYANKSLRYYAGSRCHAKELQTLNDLGYGEGLQTVKISACGEDFGAAGFVELAKFKNLRNLRLSSVFGGGLNNETIVGALNALAPSLEVLDIWYVKELTGDGFLKLDQMPNLRSLHLDNMKSLTETTANPFLNFSNQFPNLRKLNVAVCDLKNYESVASLCPANAESNLTWLRLYQNQNVSEVGFEKFFNTASSFPNLTHVDVSYNAEAINDRILKLIVDKCGKYSLRSLNLRTDSNISDEGIFYLFEHTPNLEVLDISCLCFLSLAILDKLVSCRCSKTLRKLNISGSGRLMTPADKYYNPNYLANVTDENERKAQADQSVNAGLTKILKKNALPNFESLILSAVTPQTLRFLHNLDGKRLRLLDLQNAMMTMKDDELDVIEDAMLKGSVSIETLSLKSCWKIKGDRLRLFLKRLKEKNIPITLFSDSVQTPDADEMEENNYYDYEQDEWNY